MNSVALAGPASPRALADLLSGADRDRALRTPGLGGSAVNNLARALVEEGISVELVTLAPEAEDATTLQGDRLRVSVGPYRRRPRDRTLDLFRAERHWVRRLVEATSAPLIDAHWTYEFAFGALASRGRVVSVSAHDAPLRILRHSPDAYRVGRTLLAALVRIRLSRLTAKSPYLARVWRRDMRFRGPISVVPNVVPIGPRQSRAVPSGDAPTILDVTDANHRKNAASLLRAMVGILRVQPEARCRLVGPGVTRDSYLGALAERLGVSRSVEFLGGVDAEALDAEYARATVFVHPSLEESFGMSIAEAMSHGLPVVGGSRSGAVPWVLGEGEAGVLVDVRDPNAIATAVLDLIEDRTRSAELGRRAAARVRDAFSPPVVGGAAMLSYEEALEAGR